jgi:beta-aspartyl-peptidase (threonine type)
VLCIAFSTINLLKEFLTQSSRKSEQEFAPMNHTLRKQSLYQSIFVGTPLFTALSKAARSNVAIGGTSAGMAMLGQSAYIDVPWDSVKSRFVTQQPQSPRVQIMTQGSQLPFAGLTCVSNAPLGGIITDTHFSTRDRMGRLTAFMARNGHRGLGVDESTALLITSVGNE